MPERDLLKLIELCYEAVANPAAWYVFLAACREAFDATVATVGTVQFQPRRLDWVVIDGIPEASAHEIADRGVQDPRATLFPTLPPGRGYLFDETGHDIAAFKRSSYYIDYQRKLDFLWAVIVRLDEGRGIDGLCALHRPEQAAPFTPDDLRHAEVLAKHIGRARRLQIDLQLTESRSTLHADLLNRLPIGLVVLGSDQRVLEVNRATRSIAEASDGISLREGTLVFGDRTAQRTYTTMVNAAARGLLDGVGGLLAVPRPSGAPDYVVSVARCFGGLSALVGPRASVVVAIADPAREAATTSEALKALWQLTAAEARVALALVRGESPEAIAERQNVTLATVRVHLKHILAKTGTHRQSELIRLILAGPAALPPPSK